MNANVFLSFDVLMGLAGLAIVALLLVGCRSTTQPLPEELLWKTIQVGNPPPLRS